jgi:hypothetical protein
MIFSLPIGFFCFATIFFLNFLCYLCFCWMQTQKKARNGGVDQQVSTETKDGMNERDLKLKVMGQQAGVEDVGLGLALVRLLRRWIWIKLF